MKLGWTAVLLVLLAGCGSTNGASGSVGTKPIPSPGATPATKKELPWLNVPGGQMKTTLFYPPVPTGVTAVAPLALSGEGKK